jgi:hypothetical protein
MMNAFFCLLLPALGCPQYADYTPSVAALERNRPRYDSRVISLTGRVQRLDQWHARSGAYDYEVFYVCEDTLCVRVFMEAHSPIADGRLVRVRGPYYRAYRSGARVYHDEIEATEVTPLE